MGCEKDRGAALMVLLKNGTSILGAPLDAMLTIIDDDGHQRFFTDLLPLIKNKNVPITSAVIGKNISVSDVYMTWEQVAEAYSFGAEIINHTYAHKGQTEEDRSADEIYMDYTKNARLMNANGITTGGSIIAYPGGSAYLDTVQDASHRYAFGAFRATGNKINRIGETDLYAIDRYRIDTDYHYDIDELKGLLDGLSGGWMVWMIHTSSAYWTTYNGATAIASAIDYAKSKGIPLVTTEYGIAKLRGLL